MTGVKTPLSDELQEQIERVAGDQNRQPVEVLLAQQCVANVRRILVEARKVHSRQDYTRMAEPILLEIQRREQEILECFSRELEQPIAS
jgi:hypothetical protein